jgi:dTDP-glucose 4,6-dehydratase
VKHILKYLGKTEDLIEFTKDRPGHDRRYAMNSGKIQRELGWTPKTDFQTGIANTIEWYMRNKDWWKSVQQR